MEISDVRMWILLAIPAIAGVLFQPTVILGCDVVNWMDGYEVGWSECPKTDTYLRGIYGNDPSGNKDYLLEDGKCCPTDLNSYASEPASCKNADWVSVLDR